MHALGTSSVICKNVDGDYICIVLIWILLILLIDGLSVCFVALLIATELCRFTTIEHLYCPNIVPSANDIRLIMNSVFGREALVWCVIAGCLGELDSSSLHLYVQQGQP